MSTTTTEQVCEKCNGTGQYIVDVNHRNGGSSSTHLCECRRQLPPRYGKVYWWTNGTVHSEDFGDSVLLRAYASIDREVPISEDNYVLHRTQDNRHFNNGLTLEVDTCQAPASVVRDFAAWLLKLSDKMDELDRPIPDEVTR
jgi:hypothetical protein